MKPGDLILCRDEKFGRHRLMLTEIVRTFAHSGRLWHVAKYRGSFFARDDQEGDTGPFSTPDEAEEWVRAIRP